MILRGRQADGRCGAAQHFLREGCGRTKPLCPCGLSGHLL